MYFYKNVVHAPRTSRGMWIYKLEKKKSFHSFLPNVPFPYTLKQGV